MDIQNPKIYGQSPFKVCVIHGGPGAAGEMAPVAAVLSSTTGVLEPYQTADSVRGQIEELQGILEMYGTPPLTLIGYSWGAWLGWITASKSPELVKKLILVSSGPFEEKFSAEIQERRMQRLSKQDRFKVQALLKAIDESEDANVDELFARFGTMINQADSYDPVPETADLICRFDIFQNVWTAASELRKSGKLLAMAESIHCPVTVIHGEYDPHPAGGVREPLSGVLNDFKFLLLKNCGHKPWIENQARDHFFKILYNEIFES